MGKQDRPDDGDEMIVVNLPNVDPVEAHVMYVGLLCFGRGYTKVRSSVERCRSGVGGGCSVVCCSGVCFRARPPMRAVFL